jgi:hypothetical protein
VGDAALKSARNCPVRSGASGRFEAEAANEPGHIVEATVYRQAATPGLNPVCGAEIEEIRWLSLTGGTSKR